jgi:YbgC/YbaW family acyl-CoA thioester hydrolase
MRDNTGILLDKTILSVEAPIKVNTYDIDAAGHVNNIVYFRWLEELRYKLFLQIQPIEKLLEASLYPVVVASDAKYKKQIKLFDKPFGIMILHDYSHGVFILKVEIRIEQSIAFTATQKCVLVDLKSNKMIKSEIHQIIRHGRN